MNNWFNNLSNDPRVRAARQAVENLPAPVRSVARAGAIGVGVGAAVFVTPPLLGFTGAGVAAGSIAATIQSVFYGGSVGAGSAFAIMQSIGATGTVVPAVVAAVSAGGTAAATGGGGGGGNNDGEGQAGVPGEDDGNSDNGGDVAGAETTEKASAQKNLELMDGKPTEELPPYSAAPIHLVSLDDDKIGAENEIMNGAPSVGHKRETGLVRPRNNDY